VDNVIFYHNGPYGASQRPGNLIAYIYVYNSMVRNVHQIFINFTDQQVVILGCAVGDEVCYLRLRYFALCVL